MRPIFPDEPIEIIDPFRWEERSKIITRDVHGIGGLKNFTHLRPLASEPSTPLHYHKDIMEIHCILKGRRNSRLYIDGQAVDYVYTGGEALVIFPGEPHITGNDTQQSPCEVFALQVDLSEPEDFLGLNPQRGKELCAHLRAMKHRHLRLPAEEFSLLREAFSLFSKPAKHSRDRGLMYLLCFLHQLIQLSPVRDPLKTAPDDRISRAIRHIHENIMEPLPLQTLADLAGYSLSRFKTKFREETGQTPALYISASKVEAAKKMLVDTDHSVTYIGYSLGWSSGNYFCTVFKKLTGTSPLQYRKKNR